MRSVSLIRDELSKLSNAWNSVASPRRVIAFQRGSLMLDKYRNQCPRPVTVTSRYCFCSCCLHALSIFKRVISHWPDVSQRMSLHLFFVYVCFFFCTYFLFTRSVVLTRVVVNMCIFRNNYIADFIQERINIALCN